jgi:hypothetical protein
MAASKRLENQRLWIAVAILRSYEIENVPEKYTAEPLDSRRSKFSILLGFLNCFRSYWTVVIQDQIAVGAKPI